MSAARSGRRGQRTNFAAAADRTQRTGPASKRPAADLRVKPVRITLDLDPALYSELQTLRRQIGADIDANVTMAKLSRVLYRRLLDDPSLLQDVRADLHNAEHENDG